MRAWQVGDVVTLGGGSVLLARLTTVLAETVLVDTVKLAVRLYVRATRERLPCAVVVVACYLYVVVTVRAA